MQAIKESDRLNHPAWLLLGHQVLNQATQLSDNVPQTMKEIKAITAERQRQMTGFCKNTRTTEKQQVVQPAL